MPVVHLDLLIKNASAPRSMVHLDVGWRDVGNWRMVFEAGNKDSGGNVVQGDVINMGSKNCLFVSTSRKIATFGIRDLAVVETRDAVLVAPLDQVDEIKALLAVLKDLD